MDILSDKSALGVQLGFAALHSRGHVGRVAPLSPGRRPLFRVPALGRGRSRGGDPFQDDHPPGYGGHLFRGIGPRALRDQRGCVPAGGVAMFASAGVVGIAIGFASQTTAANLVSGVLIAFAQPLRLGDRVEVEQEQGSVEEIGLLYTSIRTWDNRHVMIPNQLLSSRVIRNFSLRDPRSPAVVTFGSSQDADLDWVRSMRRGGPCPSGLLSTIPHRRWR